MALLATCSTSRSVLKQPLPLLDLVTAPRCLLNGLSPLLTTCSTSNSQTQMHITCEHPISSTLLKGYAHVYYPASIQPRYMCVCVCVCVCVCYGEVAASISSLANWCMVLCIYIYICKCTNVHIKIVWVCCIHPAQLQTLWVIDCMLSGLSLLCCSPFRQACCC